MGPERTRILVGLAQAGHAAAKEQLLLRYRATIGEEIRRLAGERSSEFTSDDLEQEVFEALLRSLPGYSYRGPHSFEAWLRKVARHRVLDCLEKARARKRRPSRPVLHLTESLGEQPGAIGPLPSRGPSPSEVVGQKEERDWIAEGIQSLEDPYRSALALAYGRNLSCSEIASEIGRTREATRKLISRGIDKLERALYTTRTSQRNQENQK